MTGATLRRVFPAPCAVAQRETTGDLGSMVRTGTDPVRNAVAARQREFAAGRAAARAALEVLGFPDAVIGCGPDRAPQWPTGAVGSIAHSGGRAMAVAARANEIAALGIDLERNDRVDEGLWRQVMRQSEIDWLRRFPPAERVRWATVMFCAKEAFYKFQHPLMQAWLDFDEVEVRIAPDRESFTLTSRRPVLFESTPVYNFGGGFAVDAEFTLAGLYWPVESRQIPGARPKTDLP